VENTNIGTSSAEFMALGAGARGMALGGSFSALTRDVEALYYNPAGIAMMDGGLQGMATVMPYFADTHYYWVGLAFPWDYQWAIGLSFGSFGFGNQPVYTEADPEGASGEVYGVSESYVAFSFAHAFIDRFTGGVTAKIIIDQLGKTSATGFAFDIGTNFHTELGNRPIAFSVVIQNLAGSLEHSGAGLDFAAFPGDPNNPDDPSANVDPSPSRFQSQSFPIPTAFRVGIVYDVVATLPHRLSMLGEFVEPNAGNTTWGLAGEYEYGTQDKPISAALRASYNYQADNYLSAEEEAQFAGATSASDRGLDGLALGAGLKWRFSSFEAQLDYVYRHFGTMGTVDAFTIAFRSR
jgi:hypothetical protein